MQDRVGLIVGHLVQAPGTGNGKRFARISTGLAEPRDVSTATENNRSQGSSRARQSLGSCLDSTTLEAQASKPGHTKEQLASPAVSEASAVDDPGGKACRCKELG